MDDDIPSAPLTKGAEELFNNPAARQLRESMPPELREKFKTIGKAMYGSYAYEQSSTIPNMPAPMAESLLHIELAIRSGMLPEHLTKNEVRLLREGRGPNWHEHYGFTLNQIPESLRFSEEDDMPVPQNLNTQDTS